MFKIVAIVAGAGLALVVAAAFVYGAFGIGPAHTRTETHAFPQPVRTLSLENAAGDIELVRGERLVVREAHHYHAKQKLDVSRRIDGDTLTIEDHGCTGRAVLNDGCSTDFHVQVPAGIALRITTHAGDVRATGIEAPDVRAETSAGNVRATALSAPAVHAETSAGDVELDLLRAPRLVDARTDAGDVEIAVPAGTYAVTTDTDAGGEDVTGVVNDPRAPNQIRAQTDAGDVDVHRR
jgi:hypothetical protein